MKLGKTLAVAGAAAAVGIAGWALAKPPQASDAAEIRELERNWAKAFQAKNPDEIMKFYEPGPNLVVFDVIPPRQYVVYDAYKKDWADFFATLDGTIEVEVSDLAVGTSGNLGYSHSIQSVRGKNKDGKPMDLTVRVTDIYRKIGGKWLIVHEHVSVPVDLDTGKADLQSKP